MKRAKRRNKRYVPKPVRQPMIIGAQLVMGPLEAIIDQIERDGTVYATSQGTPIFRDGNGKWYDTAAALEGVIWLLEMNCTRHSIDLPIQPLKQLHACLKYMSPINETLIENLRSTLPVIQRAMALADPDDQVDLFQQTRIKDVMEKQGVAHDHTKTHNALRED